MTANSKPCPRCHRGVWPYKPYGPDGMHEGCYGAAATQALIKRSHAAMVFAGVPWSPWRLVADLYEPAPWRPLSVQYDTAYGPVTFTQRTDVIELLWDFFGPPLTRVDSQREPFVVAWSFEPYDESARDRVRSTGHYGYLSRREPIPLGNAVADLLAAAATYTQLNTQGAPP